MITVKPDKLSGIVPRILELTSRNTPWHRRDWRAGTLELVEEVITESQIPGTYKEALEELRTHMSLALNSDPAITARQKQLIKCVKTIDPESDQNSYSSHLARHHCEDVRQTYLQNWAEIFSDPARAGQLDIEGSAKRIVSHLLYLGMAASSVYNLIHTRDAAEEEFQFSEVLLDLDDRSRQKMKNFTFAVPVDRAPDFLYSRSLPSGWLSAKDLKQWKHKHAPQADSVRHHGGFTLTIPALDVNAAAEEAQRQLSQLTFKFEAGSENRFSVLPLMWSQDKGTHFPTQLKSQPLKLQSFLRSQSLSALQMSSKTRNILAIIEPLQTNNPHVAIVNGWVAIESLLSDSNESDRVSAERTATIVAASYFRSEITWLAGNYAKAYGGNTEIGSKIINASSSLDRSRLMVDLLLLENSHLDKLDETDKLAVDKMRVALHNPGQLFDRTQEILKREFLRMYRKRNLIVHSGRVVEHGIESLATKVVPLLVTAIDQILIANLQYDLDPRALAASVTFKASRLSTVDQSNPYRLLELLEP